MLPTSVWFLFLVSLAAAATTSTIHNMRPKIILWGDSLTQTSFDTNGWGATLANVYQRRADVLNRGYSGYNTEWFLRLVPSTTPSSTETSSWELCSPDEYQAAVLVILFLGANDAALPNMAPSHVPLERYTSNLHTLLDRIRAKCPPTTSILLVTPPPIVHAQRLEYQRQRYGEKATGVLERTLEHTGMYAQACCQVATERSVPCVSLYTTMQEHDDWESFFTDGLHFSKAGHGFVGQAILQAIATHFPHLVVTPDAVTGFHGNSASRCPALNAHGPFHDHINPMAPDPAFAAYMNSSGSSPTNPPDHFQGNDATTKLTTTETQEDATVKEL
jgi:isoamyl acetate esterase